MKKIICFLIVILLLPISVFAEETNKIKGEYGTYSDASKIIKEVMKSYYIRGPYIQYNYAKTKYGFQSPEIATSQNILHMVCAAYAYDVYTEAFAMNHSESSDSIKFPRYNTEVIAIGRNYYKNNVRNVEELTSGKFLIYYKGPNLDIPNPSDLGDIEDENGIKLYDTDDVINFTYNNSIEDINTFARSIRPGDIFAYSGHVLVAYDVFQNDAGDWDVLLLNSGQSLHIPTRISSTSKLSYDLFKSVRGNNNIVDVDGQGTIKWISLRQDTHFIKNGSLQCPKTDECVVIRPFYEKDGKAIFNFTINKDYYNKSLLRSEYPGLIIEKTVNKGTNNSVYIGDELKYTIKITNKSGVTYNPQTYKTFYVEEDLGNYVDYVSSNGTYNNKKIKWKVDNLGAGITKELTYTVKVKNEEKNVSNEIEAYGKFYNNESSSIIEIGTIKNKIIPKVTKYSKSYNNCYNEKKNSYFGLNLIDEIYKCVFEDEDLDLGNFDFNEFFVRSKTIATSKAAENKAYVNNSSKYKDMVLNNYWSAMVLYSSSGSYHTIIPRLSSDLHPRASTIYPFHFKDGDVLIYSIDYDNGPYNSISYATATSNRHTKEKGLYAYIYLNGKFIGKNGSGDTVRNEFTYNYYPNNSLSILSHLYAGYTSDKLLSLSEEEQDEILKYVNYQTLYDKDNYVILRPEQKIVELNKIAIESNPIKTKYILNYENLDLTGGKLKVTYNYGEETIDLDDEQYNIEVIGFDNSKLGNNIVTVKYSGKEISFDVEIIDKQIEKIEIKKDPNKVKYIQSQDKLDLTGGIILITYDDGSIDEISLTNSEIKISGFDNSEIGKQEIEIEYLGKKTFLSVEIIENELENPQTGANIQLIIFISILCYGVVFLYLTKWKSKFYNV